MTQYYSINPATRSLNLLGSYPSWDAMAEANPLAESVVSDYEVEGALALLEDFEASGLSERDYAAANDWDDLAELYCALRDARAWK